MQANDKVTRMNAVFAGTFDPPTLGHLDIIARASSLFEKLNVVIGKNPAKKPLFDTVKRIDLLKQLLADLSLKNVSVEQWDGLVAEYAIKNGCRILVRSLRNQTDLPFEQVMAKYNSLLAGGMETLILLPRQELAHVSSSHVRELVSYGRLPDGLVPQLVRKELELLYGPLLQDFKMK
jgi:pantetheine-phosphate adenylyltransferase